MTWVPTYAGMKEKSSSPKVFITILVSLLITAVAYNIVSIFGLLTFGSNIESDLMVNYDGSKISVIIGVCIVAFKSVTTYPPILFCARIAMDDILVKFTGGSEDLEPFRRIVIVCIWFFSNIILALYVPDISSTIDVTGSFAILFIFILPGLVLICATLHYGNDYVMSESKFRKMMSIGIFYVLIGTFILGVTVAQVVMKDFTSESKPRPLSMCSSSLN